MQVNPYLTFNGQCAEAIKFYERVLEGKVTFQQTWGESPMANEMPAETHDKIMHATVDLDGATLMCADSPPDHYQAPRGIHITLHFKDPVEGQRVFIERIDISGNNRTLDRVIRRQFRVVEG